MLNSNLSFPFIQVYIGELSSAKLRGLFGSMVEASLVVGVIMYYALGSISGFFYYYISLVAVGIVALFEVLMIWLPETPRWLLSRGYGEDAEKVIKWLRGPAINVSKEMEEIKHQITANRTSAKIIWKILLTRKVFVPFVYVLISVAFVQLSGINAVASFAGELLSEAGVAHPRITSIYAVGIANLAGTLIALFITDLIGRKTLLIVSGLLMAVGTCMLGIHFFITRPSLCSSHQSGNTTSDSLLDMDSHSCNSQYGPLAIVSLILYNFSFSIGWGPVPWLLLSELLPLSVRGVAAGFAMTTCWVFGAITIGLYLEYAELVQPWFAMWTLLLLNLTSVLFVLLFIPETKGKTLEEVEKKFERRPKVVETVL